MRRIRPLDNNAGVALLLAVTVVSLLIAVTVQFNRDMRQEISGAANTMEAAKLRTMVKSGGNVARALLKTDGDANDFDSVHDSWARLTAGDVDGFYGKEALDIRVVDLSGRLPLNSLVAGEEAEDPEMPERTREILQRLLVALGGIEMDEERASLIIDAITDWIDEDDREQGIEATEDSYYRGLTPPYSCKNAPLEFVEELLLIRGITEELYFGGKDRAGLRDLVTVHGREGTININTAPSMVLQAMSPGMNDGLAEDMIVFRSQLENQDQLDDTGWYGIILPGDVSFDQKTVVTKSEYFRIVVQARRKNMKKTLTTVVKRKKDNNIVLKSRKIE